jgi:hypothetical protein
MTVLVVGGLEAVVLGSPCIGELGGMLGSQFLRRHIAACPARSAKREGGLGDTSGRQILGRHIVACPASSIRSPASASKENGSLRVPTRMLGGPTTRVWRPGAECTVRELPLRSVPTFWPSIKTIQATAAPDQADSRLITISAELTSDGMHSPQVTTTTAPELWRHADHSGRRCKRQGMGGAERNPTVGVSNNPVDRWTSMTGGYATRPDSSATTVTVHSFVYAPEPSRTTSA